MAASASGFIANTECSEAIAIGVAPRVAKNTDIGVCDFAALATNDRIPSALQLSAPVGFVLHVREPRRGHFWNGSKRP